MLVEHSTTRSVPRLTILAFVYSWWILNKSLREQAIRLSIEQVPLLEAFLVAVSLHVVMLPVLWVMGWALPFPKPPVITTIIEWNLETWPPKPREIFNYRDPKLNP